MVKIEGAAEATRFGERNIKALSDFASRCFRRLDSAVKQERGQHRYTNRTGAAEAATQVHMRATGVDIDVDVTMGVHYASYLNRDGWSLFDRRVKNALGDINSIEAARVEDAADE
jgi:hypothetical protein